MGVNGVIADVQKIERAREVVAVLLNDVQHSVVIGFGCISSTIFLIKFKFSIVKVNCGSGYFLNKGDGQERKKFWNDLDRVVDRVGN